MTLIAAGVLLACGGKPEGGMQADSDTNVRIGSEVSCSSCAIVIDTLATIERVFALPGSGAFARDASTGVFYIADRTDNLVKAFSSEGRPLRTIGGRGGGPGEYEQVRNVLVGADGKIHILDGLLGRHTIFTQDGNLVSTARVEITPALMSPALLQSDGQLVVNSPKAHGAGGVNTVELIDTTGEVVRSVDPAHGDRGDQWWLRSRVFWRRPNDEVLVARRYAPVIYIYAPDLTRKGSITRVADWFPEQEPQDMPGDGVFDRAVSPSVEGMWEDTQGRLWLQMLVASPDWEPRKRPAQFRPADYRTFGQRPRAQTIIEVLDVDHRRVLARSRFDAGIGAAFGGGLMADYMAEDGAGEPRVFILQLSLKE